FQAFLGTLRRTHPGCGGLRLASKPIGGIVRTYGAAGPNHFDGGILIGDAGCFVDPMTGEGITPAAESALLGAAMVASTLERGRTDRTFLRGYERAFRAYFDPAMQYLDFCACLMRNRHLAEFWIRAVTRGCELAAADADFARVSGATFGGMEVRPLAIATGLWAKAAAQLLAQGGRIATELLAGRSDGLRAAIADFGHSQAGWWTSWADDPVWHTSWVADLGQKWLGLVRATTLSDPRAAGPVELRLLERPGQRESCRVLRTSRSSPSGRRAARMASASASAARRSR
ncbi:MAG: NAD(P)/FAD-dependent oxidoreductase, partial [Anaerolineales bacterium]